MRNKVMTMISCLRQARVSVHGKAAVLGSYQFPSRPAKSGIHNNAKTLKQLRKYLSLLECIITHCL